MNSGNKAEIQNKEESKASNNTLKLLDEADNTISDLLVKHSAFLANIDASLKETDKLAKKIAKDADKEIRKEFTDFLLHNGKLK